MTKAVRQDAVDAARHSPSAQAATYSVEAQGLCKRYGSVTALEELSFTAEPGEILGVLGPNGAGKTTAIRILTAILAPTEGTFTVAGVPHTRPAEIRRRVGVLPESAGYPNRQTGEEYLRYHARLYGHSRASSRAVAQRLLDEVGLADRSRSLIASYSRGMRQRLGLARALVNDPEVVFLDEPTLGLDPAGQRQVLGLVRRTAGERGSTVLLSTHLLDEVEQVCSRVLILHRGRIVSAGTVAEVARQAAGPRRARFRVAPDLVSRGVDALAAMTSIEDVRAVDGQPGALVATFRAGPDEDTMSAGLRAVLDAGVPVLAFEVEGARLSDAFLAMTEGR
jgi:ABC-2 type transport system ATP-binding protein